MRRMLPLWTYVKCFRRWLASLNANSAIFNEASVVIILSATPTPGASRDSAPEYNPSVFSRTTIKSMLGFKDSTLGKLLHGRTFAYKLNILRRVTATLTGAPGSSGVVIGPFKHALVCLINSIVCLGKLVLCSAMQWYPASP